VIKLKKNNKVMSFEDVIGNVEIKDNVIITPDKRYVTIVEIAPINFDYKTALDKEKIIDGFAQLTKIGPVTMQIKSLSRRADVNKYINVLNHDFALEKDSHLKPYQDDYMRLIKRLGVYSGLSRRFFMVLEACGNDTEKIKSFDDAVYYLDKAKQTIRRFIRNCGNAVIRHGDEKNFLINTLYEFANKNKTIYDLKERKQAFYDEAKRITDNDEELLDNFNVPVSTLVSPEKIEFYSEYCVVDGTYYSFLYIPSKEYPSRISYAWLTGIICGAEGIDVDIFVDKKDSKSMKNKLRTKIRINKARMNTMKNTEGENYEEIGKSIQSSAYIRNRLNSGEDFFYVTTMFTLSASSLEELYEKNSAVKDMFGAIDVDLNECEYKIKEAFSSYMPLNTLDPYIYSKGKRNMTTSGLSAFYPFNSFEVSDTDGILLGISDNKTMLVIDNFDTSKYSNANITLLGTSGAGKTFTLQTMCLRFRLKGVQTFVIAPIKGDEYERGCKEVNGEFLTISSGSKTRINIMEIRPSADENAKKLGYSSKRERQSILSSKIDSLLTFFSLAIGDMSGEERTFLDDAILKTYSLKGITKDNSSLIDTTKTVVDEQGNPVSNVVYKEMPILEDLYNVLSQQKGTERLANILLRFVTGSASAFNGQTNVDLSNKYIIFDLNDLSDELKPLGMFVALEFIMDTVRQDKTQKKVVAIDEAWMLLNKNPLAAEFVVTVFKTIRGMGGSGIAATQDIEDFFALEGGKYGKAVLNNSRIKMILRLDDDEAKIVQEHFNLTHNELKTITNFSRGQVLVKANENTFTVNIKDSRKETLLITSDQKLLRKLANGETITQDDLAA
jgi:hypothetical protein